MNTSVGSLATPGEPEDGGHQRHGWVRLFPIANLSSANPGTGFASSIDRVQHLILPMISLAIFSVASYSRPMRASMLEVIDSDDVRTARAMGLMESSITT